MAHVRKHGRLINAYLRKRHLADAKWKISRVLHPAALVVTYLVVCFAYVTKTHAAPETWFEPVLTEIGNSSSGFGSSVACSNVGTFDSGNHSLFAVGAPQESSGDGKVHILSPNGVVQVLSAPMVGRGGGFGYSAIFIDDINGDTYQDLVVGEPNPSGFNGFIHVYLSTGVIAAPFSYCSSFSGPPSYGSSIHQGAGSGVLIISAPGDATPAVYTRGISHDGSSCLAPSATNYTSTEGPGSRYGQSIAEIDTGGPDLLIGAPGYSSGSGALFVEEDSSGIAAPEFVGSAAGDAVGSSVAARYSSPLVAVSAPFNANTIAVKSYAVGGFLAFMPVCTLSVPMSDVPSTAGQALAHLGATFKGFVGVGASGEVFGTYSTQESTGGSVLLFGAQEPVTCTGEYQINNCAYDPDQKQGVAIAGGPHCKTSGGDSVVIIGSPGYASSAGRIDVYQEGTELASALPCAAPTNTPTPTPTPTLTHTPTYTPTFTPSPGLITTPIPVDPDTKGLPAPSVGTQDRSVTITAPPVIAAQAATKGLLPSGMSSMLSEGYSEALSTPPPRWCRKFRRKFKLKRCPRLTRVRYQFLVVGPKRSTAATTLAVNAKASRKTSRRRRITARRNSITLRKLKPGNYTTSYRLVFTVRGTGVRTIVYGKSSAAASFTID